MARTLMQIVGEVHGMKQTVNGVEASAVKGDYYSPLQNLHFLAQLSFAQAA